MLNINLFSDKFELRLPTVRQYEQRKDIYGLCYVHEDHSKGRHQASSNEIFSSLRLIYADGVESIISGSTEQQRMAGLQRLQDNYCSLSSVC